MLSVVFAVLCAIMIYISYYISHDMINILSVFTVPYMLIIPINNLFMVHRGFYLIEDQAIYLILSSLVCIFIGYMLANRYFSVHKKNSNTEQIIEYKFSRYRMQNMLKYVFFVEIIELIRIAYIVYANGITYIVSSNFEGHITRGAFGHLLLTIYPCIPIIFLYWLKNKKQVHYLIATVLCIGLLFMSFVKYHVIGIIVLLYLFVSLEDSTYLRKGLIVVSASAIGAFVLNYFLSFMLRGVVSQVSQEYYSYHFWNYMAGSLIHDNWVFTTGTNVGMSLLFKIVRVVLTPFVSLVYALFGVWMEPVDPVTNIIDYVPLGSNGEIGNVVDAFGYFFRQRVI